MFLLHVAGAFILVQRLCAKKSSQWPLLVTNQLILIGASGTELFLSVGTSFDMFSFAHPTFNILEGSIHVY